MEEIKHIEWSQKSPDIGGKAYEKCKAWDRDQRQYMEDWQAVPL